MPKYRKKPVEIEAMQWTGDNTRDFALWVDPEHPAALPTGWWLRRPDGSGSLGLVVKLADKFWEEAAIGDWVIRDAKGRLEVWDNDLFEHMFVPVEG